MDITDLIHTILGFATRHLQQIKPKLAFSIFSVFIIYEVKTSKTIEETITDIMEYLLGYIF